MTPTPKSIPATPDQVPHARLDIKRSVVSQSRFPNKSSLDIIAKHLHMIGATGKLTIDFSQGGINSVSFEARHSLNGSDKLEIQFTNL
jgi:hypothetical protein